jgi:hypothetical protein
MQKNASTKKRRPKLVQWIPRYVVCDKFGSVSLKKNKIHENNTFSTQKAKKKKLLLLREDGLCIHVCGNWI